MKSSREQEEAWEGKSGGKGQDVRIGNVKTKQGKAVKSRERKGRQEVEEEGDGERLRGRGEGTGEEGKNHNREEKRREAGRVEDLKKH